MTVSAGAAVEVPVEVRVGPGRLVRVALVHGRAQTAAQFLSRIALAAGVDTALVVAAQEHGAIVELAQAFRDARLDAVLLSGDARDAKGVALALDALRLGCAAQRPLPIVYVIGAAKLADRVRTAAKPFALDVLADATAAIIALRALRRREADQSLRDEIVEDAARALAASTRGTALVIDVSEQETSCAFAGPEGIIDAAHLVSCGVGAASDRLVADIGVDRIRRWLPWPVDAPALLERIYNRAGWPGAVPGTELALALEMALAREAVAHLLRAALSAGCDVAAMREARSVLATGRIAAFPRLAQTLLTVVDGVEPTGLTSVWREPDDGRAARIALVLTVPERATKLRLVHANGRNERRVSRGSFDLVPLGGDVDVSIGSLRGTGNVGALGLLVDARGRPLGLPHRDAERLPVVARHFAAVGALPGGLA